jgi:hypothetical protein
MPRENSDTSNDRNQRQRALSRWDNEGGAGPDGPASDSASETERTAIPDLTNAELVTLRIRVIALENLMISLLATASDDQLRLAREMAGYISPARLYPASSDHSCGRPHGRSCRARQTFSKL